MPIAVFPHQFEHQYFDRCLDEQLKAAGIVDEIGRDATPVDPKRDHMLLVKNSNQVVGRPVAGRTYDLLGDRRLSERTSDWRYFERDILNHREENWQQSARWRRASGNVNAR